MAAYRPEPSKAEMFDVTCTLAFFIFLLFVVLYPLEVGEWTANTFDGSHHQAVKQLIEDDSDVQQRACELRSEILSGD